MFYLWPETWEQKPIQPVNNLTILNLRGGNMGRGEPSFSSSRPPSISSSVWLWVEVSDLLKHVFPIELKLESQNSLNRETFSQFRSLGVEIWVQENLPSLPHNLSQFPLLSDCGSKFQTYYVFLCTFVISILILSCQNTISLLFIIHLKFWAWFSIISTSKEPKGRFGSFLHFRLLLQKRSPTFWRLR